MDRRTQSILRPAASAASFLDHLYSSTEIRALGFKLMLNQCQERPYVWQELVRKNVKAILVSRRNALKTLVSRRAAAKSGVYHIREGWEAPKVRINTRNLLRKLVRIEEEQAMWKSMLDGHLEYVEVVYESFLSDLTGESNTILRFLGVRELDLASKLKKVLPDELANVIANYDDVRKTLEGTPFEDFLE